MARKQEAPVDQLTNLPLLFVPDPDLPPLPTPGEPYDPTIANLHHPIHQRRVIESYGAGGEAARDAYVQWAWYNQHVAFHRRWGGLTTHMPRTEAQQYQTTLLGLMRYVPEHGIYFPQGRDPHVITMTNRDRELLRLGGQIIVDNDGVRARRFLLNFSVTNGLAGADERLVEKFVRQAQRHNRDPEKLVGLGELLLNQTIDPVVTPDLRELYAYTRRNHMLRPGLPKTLGSVVRGEILSAFRSPHELVHRLSGAFAAARPELAQA